jgi:hypothetical protein
MSHIVKLTVKGRNDVIKYAHNLPSTLGTYFNFDAFLSLFEFTPEEEEKYEIRIEDGEIKCNCPEREFEIDTSAIPEPIMAAIRTRVADYREEMAKLREANKGNPDYKDSPLFTAIVESLGALIPPEEEKEEGVRDPQFRILK